MIEITDKSLCCGCSACKSICPQNCIKMEPDSEGFLYPVVDNSKCINCNLCEKVCPIINNKKETEIQQKAYLVQHKDEKIRMESSAGGAFTAIAEHILEKNGVVFGAQYDNELNVIHNYVEKSLDLYKFRNSKYVQSNLGDVFSKVRSFLDEGRYVVFSGTPCQIEGLTSFLRKDYEKLILVDVVCHAIPSPLIWNRYKKRMFDKYGDITNIRFRDKYYGYQYSAMSVFKDDKNKPVYHEGIDTDFMLRAFFSDICDRPSCYNCKFKKRYRVSDFTIWDCFTVGKMNKLMDDNKGTTRVLIHSQKGKRLFDELKDRINCFEVEPDELVKNVKEMYYSVSPNKKRDEFFDDARSMPDDKFFRKYFNAGLKTKIEKTVRVVSCKLGIYDFVKSSVKKILGK